jgi:hypothetical protein
MLNGSLAQNTQVSQNTNDHESGRCAYIRRHSPKIVAATASAPHGNMLA